MKRILFVDNDLAVLQSIYHWLYPLRDRIEAYFAQSGVEAVNYLAQAKFDMIVADLRMSTMDGVELLDRVQKQYPQMVRIILSNASIRPTSLKTITSAHRYLIKPLDPNQLTHSLLQACMLSDFLQDADLQRVVSQTRSLPSLPSLYLEIVEELESPNPSAERVGQIIGRDMGMASKVLQLVNSAFFGLPRQVNDPGQATVMIGMETIRDLVLSINLFSQFDRFKLDRLSMNKLWDHCLDVSSMSRRMVKWITSDKNQIEHAMLAGFLHDVGKLIFAENLTEKYYQTINLSLRKRIPLYQAELDLLGTTHMQVGAYLLALWDLPDAVINSAACHHTIQNCQDTQNLIEVAVHTANGLDYETNPKRQRGEPPVINQEIVAKFGLSKWVDDWRKDHSHH
jgi:putative nucleotidyltransferase with HDIG domain